MFAFSDAPNCTEDSQGELSPISADEAALSDVISRVITANYLVG
jgi:hypothetical protein